MIIGVGLEAVLAIVIKCECGFEDRELHVKGVDAVGSIRTWICTECGEEGEF